MKSEKIRSLIVSIALVLGLTLSLSSCASVLDMVDEIFGDQLAESDVIKDGGDKDKGDGGSVDKPTGGDDNITGGGTGSSDVQNPDEEDKIEFYPGQGSVDAENISAKNRILLSTVVIMSQFGASPSAGSGVIYKLDKESGDAYIITNYHVVCNSYYGMCDSAKVYLYGMERSDYAMTATVVGGSEAYEIAVLKITGSEVLKNSYAMEASFEDSDSVRVFDEVFVVGNAEGYGMSATDGIVSVDSEKLSMSGATGSAIELRVMRVSAAINKGNSGGGVYNADGKLVGVVVAKRTGADVDNMGYAIPSNLAKNLVDNIIYFCADGSRDAVQRPLIGVTISAKAAGLVADSETGELKKAEIIEITELTDTCIAKDLIKVGDVVNSITVDGVTVKVTRLHHVIDHMLTARVGSTVVLNVTRGEETLDLTFTVPRSAFSSVR